MGNFWFNSKTQDTGILNVIVNEEGMQSLQFVPAIQSGCKTTIAPDEERERILNYIQSLSPTITIDNAGYITRR
jgi:poly-gamma-glutamate synthesis protein (capsule biosynthesis protein)